MESAFLDENPDYLAKDYDSFRALMLDHLARIAPAWSERDPGDIVVALVEVLAYVGDYLSYYQDAVAAEAYLATARRRASVRRHARLVDHRLGEGVSARVLAQIVPAVSEVRVARGCALLADAPGLGVSVSKEDYEKYDGIVFETMHDVVLVREHTEMMLAEGETPRPGDVRARLRGCLARLARGDILLLRHVESDYLHPIRLIDVVPDGAETALEWQTGDAVPLGAPDAGAWTVHGNLVLADHGRTCERELPPLPSDDATFLRCGQLAHACPYDHAAALGTAAVDALHPDDATAVAAMILHERAAFLPAGSPARAVWIARRDILNARADERVFVAEPDGHGAVELRFGDGCCGRRPRPEWTYVARYRVGQGTLGNIGPSTLKHIVGAQGLITRVDNQLVGKGGVDPESLEHARAMASSPRSRPTEVADPIARLLDAEFFADAPRAHLDGASASSRAFTAPMMDIRGRGASRAGDAYPRPTMTYATCLRRMRHLASLEPPLDRLSTAAAGDVTNALMSAWARVCDVLAFYQRRIADEGFIGTAREPLSIRHLAYQLGVSFRPALGSSTHLVATMFEEGRPEGIVVEPGALSVQDAPIVARQQPIIFESSTRATLRPSWNDFAALAATRTQVPLLWKGCTSLRVVGTATGARPDRAVLITAPGETGIRTWLVTIASVLIDRKSDTTLLTWDDGLPDDGGPWPAGIVEAVLFQSSVGLFGRTAPPWDSLPEAKRLALGTHAGGLLCMTLSDIETGTAAWAPLASDLPTDADVRAMLSTPSGILLAGTSKGVFRSADGGAHWVRAMLAALVPSVFALHLAPDGVIYAGGAKGAIFASADDGQSWSQMPAAVVGTGSASHARQPPLGCTVRAIVTVLSGSSHLPMIGIDQGVYVWGHTSWMSCNQGFPGRGESLAGVSVRDLIVTAAGGLAATSAGLYTTAVIRASVFPLVWNKALFDPLKPIWHRSSLANTVFALVSVADDAGFGSVLVGTDDGIFEMVNGEAGSPTERRSLEKDLAGRHVWRLSRIGEHLLAATDSGLFASPRKTRSWRACDTQSVRLFDLDADDDLRAALERGRAPPLLLDVLAARGVELMQPVTVSRLWRAGSARCWRLREADTQGRAARALELVDGDPIVVKQSLPLPGPAVVASAASGRVLAATPFGASLSRDWPNFHIASGRVFLDRAIADLEPGQRMVLALADGRTKVAPLVYAIRQVARGRRAAFGRTATATELTTEPDPRQQALDLRRTLAHVAPTPLVPYAPLARAVSPVDGDTLTAAITPEGLQAGHAVLLSGPRPGAAIVRMGGIVAIGDWPKPAMLEQESILALAAAGRSVFAATASGLMVEWPEGGPCRAANEGLPLGAIVQALAVHSNGCAIVAATTGQGVFCRRLEGDPGSVAVHRWFLLGQPQSAEVTMLAVTLDGHVLAGTSLGVSTCVSGRTPDAPPDWSAPAIGRPVHALAVGPDGRSFAGCDDGAVWTRSPGAAWTPLPAIAPASRVNALAAGSGGMLVAGCEDGRVLLHADRVGWRSICRIPRGAAVRTLLIADGRLLIGTRGAGVFERMRGGGLRPVPTPESSDVTALIVAGSGAILAGRDAAVHLAGERSSVMRRSRLADAGADSAPALDRCLVPPALALIFANAGAKLSSDVGVEVLAPGSRWLIRDKDCAWIAERLPPNLIAAGTPALLRLFATDLLDVAAAPAGGEGEWTIVHEAGLARFSATRDEVVHQAARSDQPVLSEIATLRHAEPVPGGTRLVLVAPLRRAYDRERLRISGNLVPVTQGDTVAAEVLGSGNQADARQHFSLHRSPVTRLRTAEGIASSLQIRIRGGRPSPGRAGPRAPQAAGQRWHETTSFLLHGPGERVYRVEYDEKGRTSVHFGDGVNGARLPSGKENVVAAYRWGAGHAGNVAAGTLVALRHRPMGIRTVTNPVAATGGHDAQTVEDLRIRIPWQREPRQPIVSLADYATFVAGFPGIGRTQAQIIDGERRTLCLWVATDDGTPIEDVPGLIDSLQAAVAAARSDRLALHVGGFAKRIFPVAARIVTRRLADFEVVAMRARSALLDAFSTSGHASAGRASPDDVRLVLEGVAGVASALVTADLAVGRPPGLAEWPIGTARWDRATSCFRPPTLHLVDPANIILDVGPA